MKIELIGDNIVNLATGEAFGGVNPKFQDWKYDDYRSEYEAKKELRFLELMSAQEFLDDKFVKVMNEIGDSLVAEQKFDGHRTSNQLTHLGNRMFSRRVSKVTGWYAENSDQLPHIRDIIVPQDLYGTVIDGELLLPVEGCTCRQVQSVTGALPETAIQHQLENGFAYINAFDILYYKGLNIQKMPYWKRKLYLLEVIKGLNSPFVKFTQLFATQNIASKINMYTENMLEEYITIVKDYQALCNKFFSEGKEGLILKNIEAPYEQKRSKNFIKLKPHKTFDVVIMGFDDSTKEYTGKDRATWTYWEDLNTQSKYEIDADTPTGMSMLNDPTLDLMPITKLHYMGWIGAIRYGVWKEVSKNDLMCKGFSFNEFEDLEKRGYVKVVKTTKDDVIYRMLVEVGTTSGMTEEVRQMFSEDKESYIGQVIEVEAQGLINMETGSLQHPRYICLRPDKSSEMCTFEAHIREEEV